ncbi:hypothetical protein Ami103574_00120 [Aminipila butyrica]|uniref:DUF6291 domain-containing protein n=1 Tax=Aminipila butyrica TaxID=433296 RepID=A0A858BRK4_9FIRM|nr:DUF6291 domain-containing protein [Aminipila butyrica]QIB67819.1 hypothetical protein Ami103574_00120 [Aminipila butyrica]
MEEKKKSFVLYTTYEEQFKLLSPGEQGSLIMAIFQYVQTDRVPPLDGMAMMAFSFIKANLDRDTEKYQGIVKKRAEAGRKGGIESAKQKQANQANATFAKQNQANQADNDNVNDNDINNNDNKSSKKDIEDFFKQIWQLYPIKKGKASISDTQKKKLYSIGLEEMTRAISRYVKEQEAEKTERKYWKHGSTFLNCGYIDYLDENCEDKPKESTGLRRIEIR